MKVLFDTSTLVAAVVQSHPAHAAAFAWLQRAQAKADQGFVAAPIRSLNSTPS